MSYVLWQKPYGEQTKQELLFVDGRIFCPFLHGTNEELIVRCWTEPTDTNIQELFDYHSSIVKKYKPPKTYSVVQKYIRTFNTWAIGSEVIIPCKSFTKDPQDNTRGILVKITSNPYYVTDGVLPSLVRDVEIINNNQTIPPGIRNSICRIRSHA